MHLRCPGRRRSTASVEQCIAAVPADSAVAAVRALVVSCSPTPPGGWASGSSTGWPTAEKATPSSGAKRGLLPAPSPTCSPPGPRWSPRTTSGGSSATGTYDAGTPVIVRYRTRDGQSGSTPSSPRHADGTALLVDRAGWQPTTGQSPPTCRPAHRRGDRRGWVRADASGDSSTAVDDLSTQAISSTAIGGSSTTPRVAGSSRLKSEDASRRTGWAGPELPELDNGPHFLLRPAVVAFGLLRDRRLLPPRVRRVARPRHQWRPFTRDRVLTEAPKTASGDEEREEAGRPGRLPAHARPNSGSASSVRLVLAVWSPTDHGDGAARRSRAV